MTVDQMRKEIAKVYPGEAWQRKVDRMYDDQVIAIYYKFEKTGKFDEYIKNKAKARKYKNDGVQLSIDDLYWEVES